MIDFKKKLDSLNKSVRETNVAIDIDGVLANFLEIFLFRNPSKKWHEINATDIYKLDVDKDFWLSLKPMENPVEWNFKPYCYITARTCDKSFTEEWLHINNFPDAPVIFAQNCAHSDETSKGSTKSDYISLNPITHMVEDNLKNFILINHETDAICLLKKWHYNSNNIFKDFEIDKVKDLEKISNFFLDI